MAAKNLNQAQLQALLAEETTVLVDYWAPWCGYCRRIGPAYDQIAQQYADRLTAVKINIDEEGPLAQAEGIDVIPTLILYQNGKAVASVTAPQSKAAIDAFLAQSLNP